MISEIRSRSFGATSSSSPRNSKNPKNPDNPVPAGSNKELEIIEQNVRLCRDLLTMWQNYGSVEAAPHKVISVSEIVREVVNSVGAMAKETAVELKCDVADDPCSVIGDAVQITRAIQNVVINAIQAADREQRATSR